MIVFKLTMPHIGSWNNKWSGQNKLYIRTRDERKVPKELWNKKFFYRWEDGWEACISTEKMKASEALKLERKSDGFCGYDWMIKSIIEDGYIHIKED